MKKQTTLRLRVWLVSLLGLFWCASAAWACPSVPSLEALAVRADTIGLVVPISTAYHTNSDDTYYETLVRVIERVRGPSGVTTLRSHSPLPQAESLVLAEDCGVGCEGTFVSLALPRDSATSAARSGDWFRTDAGGYLWSRDHESLRIDTIDGPDGPQEIASWRSLMRVISGAEDWLACLDRAEQRANPAACALLEGIAREDCWNASDQVATNAIEACAR